MNVPPLIGQALSSGKTTMAELQRLSVEDLWDILEVVEVDAHNRRLIDAAVVAAKRKRT